MLCRQQTRRSSARHRFPPALSLVLAATLISGCDQLAELGLGDERQYQAKARVKFILDTVRDVGNGTQTQLQTAICRWYDNSVLISDRNTLGAASDAFDRWRVAGGMVPKLETYEMGKVETVDGPDPAVWVSVNINNSGWRWLRVPKDGSITWEE